MSEVESRTRFVTNDAPTVDVVVAGVKALRTYRWTREVLPTPGILFVSSGSDACGGGEEGGFTLRAEDDDLGLEGGAHGAGLRWAGGVESLGMIEVARAGITVILRGEGDFQREKQKQGTKRDQPIGDCQLVPCDPGFPQGCESVYLLEPHVQGTNLVYYNLDLDLDLRRHEIFVWKK